ncbi:RCC1/BLIP-II protein [Penicillium alfredii]|uniref:RCC1/BLIP-II protein n=1 Tax=Penicillium alfredii TaxID=1506179 RepID=A0A9W9KPR5_9EURO|nr:RCC1/BLIP-II protein [Penicillium alfredii]KAJ5114704.1 RCC1/BLIP-II protein [Penicillium alfredii]
MQLFGCGENSSGYLGEPRSCMRRSVNEPHICQHNNEGENSPYCPLWVLKPREITNPSQSVRVLSCENGSTFLDVDGHLKHLGLNPLKEHQLTEMTKVWSPSSITGAVPLADGFAFLSRDGSLLTVRDSNGMHTIQGKPIQHIATRRVDLHNPNLISGAVAIVLKQDPQTVLSFDSWQPMCSFLKTPAPNYHPIHTATFSSPIVKLTSKFAALTEEGEVFIWGEKLPQQPPTPSDEDEEFEDAWFEFSFTNKPIKKWPSRAPELLDYNPRKQPLPPIQELSTGGCNNTAVSRSGQLFVWGYRSNTWPDIEDANAVNSTELKEATIPSGSGEARLQIKNAAAGQKHVVALAVDGSLWSVGDGIYGQLGIGLKQFGLCTEDGVIDMLENETDEEFAVDWQRMDTEALEGRECESVFAEGAHTLIITR